MMMDKAKDGLVQDLRSLLCSFKTAYLVNGAFAHKC